MIPKNRMKGQNQRKIAKPQSTTSDLMDAHLIRICRGGDPINTNSSGTNGVREGLRKGVRKHIRRQGRRGDREGVLAILELYKFI